MSLLSNTKPVRVSFKVNPQRRTVVPFAKPEHTRIKKCDWSKVMRRLGQQYPDIAIKNLKTEDGNISFIAEFKSRPTREDDFRIILYDFLASSPDMKVRQLELNSLT